MPRIASLGKASPEGMVAIPTSRFQMGSNLHYAEEAPKRAVDVEAFAIDIAPVTNAQFAKFVDATGYVTLAEKVPSKSDYPDLLPEMAQPGSLVFQAPKPGDENVGPERWWVYCFGADWRHPWGPESTLDGLGNHPVVHVTWQDACTYAAWAGKRLPSEPESEVAARGGLCDAEFGWGSELEPGGVPMANIWRGAFPYSHADRRGPPWTTPVGSYPANNFGMFDTIGNVWEWTSSDADASTGAKGCCVDDRADGTIPRKVLKGGSHLCAINYCRRYRPAARWFQPIDTSTSHVGFRCAISLEHE